MYICTGFVRKKGRSPFSFYPIAAKDGPPNPADSFLLWQRYYTLNCCALARRGNCTFFFIFFSFDNIAARCVTGASIGDRLRSVTGMSRILFVCDAPVQSLLPSSVYNNNKRKRNIP